MVEKSFLYGCSKNFQLGSFLPFFDIHFTSPWLKKNLNTDVLKVSKFYFFPAITLHHHGSGKFEIWHYKRLQIDKI